MLFQLLFALIRHEPGVGTVIFFCLKLHDLYRRLLGLKELIRLDWVVWTQLIKTALVDLAIILLIQTLAWRLAAILGVSSLEAPTRAVRPSGSLLTALYGLVQDCLACAWGELLTNLDHSLFLKLLELISD